MKPQGTSSGRKYKCSAMQRMYDTCLDLATDPSSELYHQAGRLKGQPREGAGARCFFWRGYRGDPSTYVHGSLGHACYMAGKDFASKHPGAALVGRTFKCGDLIGKIIGTHPVPFDTPQGDLPRVWVVWTRALSEKPLPETIASLERYLG